MIYLIFLIIIVIPLFKYKKQDKGNSYYWFLCLTFILLMGLRYRVGGDCLRYEVAFDSDPTLQEWMRGDFLLMKHQPGWYLFCAVCKEIVDNFFFLQFVHCAIVNIVVFYFAKKYCNHKFTFVFLYALLQYTYFSTEIMRESLAVCIFLLSYDYIEKKKYIPYYIGCVLAFFFHASAIFIFFIPLIYKKINKNSKIQTLIIISLLVIGIYVFFVQIVSLLGANIFLGGETIQQKGEMVMNYGKLNIFGIIIRIFFGLPIFVSFIFLKDSSKNNELNKFYVSMALLVFILGTVYTPLARLQNYFTIQSLVIFVDLLYEKYKNTKIKFYYKLCLCVYIISFIWDFNTEIQHDTAHFKHYRMYYPYSSILEEEHDKEREYVMSTQFSR